MTKKNQEERPLMFDEIIEMEEDEYLEQFEALDEALRHIPPVEIDLVEDVDGGLRRLICFPDPRRVADGRWPYGINPVAVRVSLECSFCWDGDLMPDTVALGYQWGIFPWIGFREAREEGHLRWYCPLRRFVIFPEKVHVSHSMRTLLNKRRYRIVHNEAFPEVIEACGKVDGRNEQEGAWLGEEIIEAYTCLWRLGICRSVEVRDTWNGDRLVGGLYGGWVNGCFIGESMFSHVPSGSKLALIGLCEWMKENGGRMIDCQMETDHHRSMGGERISWPDYLRILNPAGFRQLFASPSAPLTISNADPT